MPLLRSSPSKEFVIFHVSFCLTQARSKNLNIVSQVPRLVALRDQNPPAGTRSEVIVATHFKKRCLAVCHPASPSLAYRMREQILGCCASRSSRHPCSRHSRVIDHIQNPKPGSWFASPRGNSLPLCMRKRSGDVGGWAGGLERGC